MNKDELCTLFFFFLNESNFFLYFAILLGKKILFIFSVLLRLLFSMHIVDLRLTHYFLFKKKHFFSTYLSCNKSFAFSLCKVLCLRNSSFHGGTECKGHFSSYHHHHHLLLKQSNFDVLSFRRKVKRFFLIYLIRVKILLKKTLFSFQSFNIQLKYLTRAIRNFFFNDLNSELVKRYFAGFLFFFFFIDTKQNASF